MEQLFLQQLLERHAQPQEQSNKLLELARYNHTPIGIIAASYVMLTADDIDLTLARQRKTGERFGEAAVALNILTQVQVEWLLEIQQFRRACHVVEAAALSGIVPFADAIASFAEFLHQAPTVPTA